MNLFGPVRWRNLGWFALLLGGPTVVLAYPRPCFWAAWAAGAAFGARSLWRRLEPIPPALAAPARPLGLLPPEGGPTALRPVPERVGPAGAVRAFWRSLFIPRTYARVTAAFLLLAVAAFAAAVVEDANVRAGYDAVFFFSGACLLGTACATGAVGVALMLRESRRDVMKARLDG